MNAPQEVQILNKREQAAFDLVEEKLQGDSDLDIDRDIAVSASEQGVWVRAWVYVANDEIRFEEGDA